MFTKTRLRQVLRGGGCLRPRDHLKGCSEASQGPLRCHQAHPPTHDDEVAGRDTRGERWFVKPPTKTRRLMRRWEQTGRTQRSRVTGEAPVFSDPVSRFAYAGEKVITYRHDMTRAIPFSSERENWGGVRDDI